MSRIFATLLLIAIATIGCYRTPAFFDAVFRGNAVRVVRELQLGAEIDQRYVDERTPLMWATALGHDTVVEVLIAEGADVNAADRWGNTPLMWAAAAEDATMLRRLLESGARVDAQTDSGWTALMIAAWNDRAENVGWLLEFGADPSLTNVHEWTALRIAEDGHAEEVAELLR